MQATLPLDRRQFLAGSGGLTLALFLPANPAEAAAGTAVNSWLTIGSDDSIQLTIGCSDMGQGSFSGLAQILCEDLMVDLGRVKLVQGAPTLAVPAPVGTAINTVGSGVTRGNFWKLRDAGAMAREMLVAAAMTQIGDGTRSNYSVNNGIILHGPSGRTLSYGQVAAAAALLPPPASAPLVPDSQFRCIGKTLARSDIPLKVDGSAVYGLDVRVPGMVYAVIRHCPSFGGKLAALPATPTGMLAIVPTQVMAGTARGAETVGNVNAVAVVGPTTWDAWQAAKRLSLKWTLPANAASLNSNQFMLDAQALMSNATAYVPGATNPPGTLYTVERSTADANVAIASAAKTLEAMYSLPYVAHACMEVLNCTVSFVPGQRCEVWAPTQSAKSALSLICAITGLGADKVTLHTTYLGGGLGRKAELDFISQALQVAMAVQRPVKLMWPREEDFTHDQYRPMALVRARVGLDANGQIAGWTYRNVSPSILGQRGANLGATGDSQGSEASNALPYNFGARLTEWVSHTAPIPVGFWRSVGASINTFAVESMIDEVAASLGQDSFQFRRARLNNPRWLAVLEAAAQAAGWGTAGPAGTARGIAIGSAFNSIVAQVVEVRAGTAGPVVTRVWVAIDCYMTVNPGSVEAQIVGGVVHAINAALYGRQTFVNGAAQVKNFNNSRMLRLNEMPAFAVKIMPPPAAADRTVPLGGVGELGVPTFAPALANAWFKLSGKRVRSLPFYPNATMSDG
ncbi:xanthine dehydrogenase family protein molybdopterin-binding subunit [Paucibacter sp. Y2R2-4]|uniref:xanthine dehydrogenase family protein molybdopterin-binding subunit n=1 Tax=Paucibacter sp. Y2R2-4 TaxID=2893553 RepID=UPI0021E3D8B6|nr:molybdopterin cofactor-binding domain-containing protein [Paucibacter sp. Y2R2-4]MCV2351134.1 molybdopterin-dependent oxidoreductase [Paucibacter sp. Y2R2-4]